MDERHKQKTALLLFATLWLVTGCASGPSTGTTVVETPADEIIDLPPDTGAETAYTARLEQAEALLSQRQLLPAASILRDLDNGKLTAAERVRVLAMDTELRYLQGDTATALQGVRESIPLLGAVSPDMRAAIDRWHLRLVLTEEGPLAAASLADRLLLSTEDPARAAALEAFVWHNLQRTPTEQLQAALANAASPHWGGWLELALLAADTMESPEVQSAQLELWRQRFPQHFSSETLPGGLELLSGGELTPPTRIALLLPLSAGDRERGTALLQGYLAAQYEARRRGWPAQELMIMDTGEHPDFSSAYDTAVRAGAELVIGPISPEALLGWEPPAENAVPLLTLTWKPELTPLELPPAQLGLSPEDEAAQLARLGFDSGARSALIIRPNGSWGDTMSDALAAAWREREGKVVGTATFTGQSDYSSSLKAALNLSESEARATRLRRLLGERTEFEPRRRDDIDIIFLLSDNPQDARSIKPLIAFHYAGDLPVYATSHIFSGRRDPQRDRDLNGIQLLEMPWLLDPEGSLQARLEAGGSDQLQSDMHALGVDAFMLNWRLAQLREAQGNRVRGNTGLLHMDESGRIHRELTPAAFEAGVPQAR